MFMALPERKHYATLEEAGANLAADLAAWLGRAVEERGRAALAVSGGRTPEHVFPILRQADLAWPNIRVTLTDERWVGPDNGASNEGLARRLLLTGPAATARLIGLKTSAPSPEEGLAEADRLLATVSWPLDAVFLGMGEDGHIASLFPGDLGWRARRGRCHAVAEAPDGRPRISLTPGALLDSRRIFLILSGAKKAAAYARAGESGPPEELPFRHILRQDAVPVSVYAAAR